MKHAIIIGAMKSGTASLYNYLIQHPSICPCKSKEPGFFYSVKPKSSTANYEDIDYSQLWNFDENVHKIALEASTGYTKYPKQLDVPKRIYEQGINPKFIYLLRNPFERILSHYNFRRVYPDFDLDRGLVAEHFINVSSYYKQLSQFLQYFPDKNQYHIVLSSDLSENPSEVLSRMTNFLGVEEDFKFDFSTKKNQTPQLTKLELFLFRTKLVSISKLFPDTLVEFSKTTVKRWFPVAEKRLLSEREYSDLYNLLIEDMLLLKQEFNVPVETWGFKAKD